MESIIKMVVVRTTVASSLSSPFHLAHTHSHLLVSLDTTLLRSNLPSFCYLLNCLIIYNSLTHTYARFLLYHPHANFVCMESSKLETLECSFSPPRDPLRLI